MTALEVFWLEAPSARSREVDPLAFGAIHEAASNRVLPFITERTRKADEYLWTLVGLDWASELGGSDGECWRLFEQFEKGLKLSWVYLLGRHTGFRGVNAVKEQLRQRRVDLDFELISEQRSQGLLGMYLSSLRNMGLVERGRLAPTTAGRTLIDGDRGRFRWDGEAGGTVKWLHIFKNWTFTRGQRKRLGRRLFGAPEMVEAASAILRFGATPSWNRAQSHLSGEAREVAKHADRFGRLAAATLASFYELLGNPGRRSRRRFQVPHFSPTWRATVFRSSLTRLAEPFEQFLRSATRRMDGALVDLHSTVWGHRDHPTPWIRVDRTGVVSVRRDAKLKGFGPPASWDHRWTVCHELIRETDWRGA